MQSTQNASFTRINQQIRANQVRLIGSDGTNHGIVDLWQALKQAKEENLDLVEINSKSTPIVVKLMDYGRFKYEESKKAKEAKKAQKPAETKEISFRPTTDDNDLNHKLAQAKEFLADGHRVRLSVKFRGREITHADIGKEKLDKALAELAELTASYTPINTEGKNMTTIVSPK